MIHLRTSNSLPMMFFGRPDLRVKFSNRFEPRSVYFRMRNYRFLFKRYRYHRHFIVSSRSSIGIGRKPVSVLFTQQWPDIT